jgi:hypothetical protein
MKKTVTLITCGLTLSLYGCAGMPPAQETAPGTALPSAYAISVCNERDLAGRCKDWSSKSDICVNPKGINEPEPVVACSNIKNGKYIAPKSSKKITAK